MPDLSRKTVCICDIGGDYTHIAEAVRGDFANVLYWSPWDRGFPSAREFLPAIGLAGIERIADYHDELNRIDLFVFTDVGYGGAQEDLRRRGFPVFGSGAAQRLERDRLFLKQMCEKAGIDCAEYAPVHGLDNLRRILKKDFEAHIKLSYFRGDGETFKHQTWLETESRLDEMALKFGPYKNLAQFILELPVADDGGPCVEVGIDTFCADGMFPNHSMWGVESKDSAFIAFTAPLPSRLRDTRDKLSPILASLNYRGAFSTETRENSGTYFIDATCRFGSPPSEIQAKFITNLAEVLWGVANGEVVEPEFKARYAAQIVMRSDWFASHPLALSIEQPDKVSIHGHCVVDGQDYAVSVSEIPEFAGAVGMGETLESAVGEAYGVADGIKGRDVNYDSGALRKILEETLKDANKLDLDWSNTREQDDAEEISSNGR